jgi:CrcB protein
LLGANFPYGTFIANISGSFLLGIAIAILHDRALLESPQRYFFVAGFLGAYTTFSTFTYESMQLFQQGAVLFGLLNVMGSVAVGLLAIFCGVLLGRLF